MLYFFGDEDIERGVPFLSQDCWKEGWISFSCIVDFGTLGLESVTLPPSIFTVNLFVKLNKICALKTCPLGLRRNLFDVYFGLFFFCVYVGIGYYL
jgi:hypothetical protein